MLILVQVAGENVSMVDPLSSQLGATGEDSGDPGLDGIYPECLLDVWASHSHFKDEPSLSLEETCLILLWAAHDHNRVAERRLTGKSTALPSGSTFSQ